MSSKFADLQRRLREEELMKQVQGGAISPADQQMLQRMPLPEVPVEQKNELQMRKTAPVDTAMLQQQLAPAPLENELAMAQAQQVAADDSFFGGMQGGFLAPDQSPDQLRKEREFTNRQKAKDSLNKYFAPEYEAKQSETFKKLKKLFRPGTEY